MRIILSYSLIAILTIGVDAQMYDVIIKGGTVYDGSGNLGSSPMSGSKAIKHPRAYGNFARLLGKYVRDEKVISLEEAIRR